MAHVPRKRMERQWIAKCQHCLFLNFREPATNSNMCWLCSLNTLFHILVLLLSVISLTDLTGDYKLFQVGICLFCGCAKHHAYWWPSKNDKLSQICEMREQSILLLPWKLSAAQVHRGVSADTCLRGLKWQQNSVNCVWLGAIPPVCTTNLLSISFYFSMNWIFTSSNPDI